MRVGATFVDAREAFGSELARWEPAIERVADLFLRMDTSQAEVAATVFFAARELRETLRRTPTEREVLDAVMAWKLKRRPQLRPEAVARGVRTLNMLGWLELQPSGDLPVENDPLLEAAGAAEV